ncbi:UPF0500 protein C1orf216 homolog [Rhineura floridana]|uniref:UPF0500 protein C1orf216 homolog n=1 Tax=Rhineura floridana TaxID=261503 RepID=UPI002AC88399|nr:UPF0500 protein C1orf216 homolog [Rhineura floridana]XP_061453382.1 UPF0500 protein C1orf216 homolog [Rhineura floridana]
MFAMYQPEIPINPLFNEAKERSQLDVAYLGGRDCRPDTNLNFMGEESYDNNENWSQHKSGILTQGESEQRGDDNAPEASDNQRVLTERQKATSPPRDVPQGLKCDGMSFGSEEEEEEEDVRSPPEGAEVNGLELEKTTTEERMKENRKLASSPLEDNGYASSSLSIDSPDSGGAAGAWDMTTVATEEWKGHTELLSPVDAEAENSPPSSETLFPALAEAFRNLQDKKKFKEREKEKHHIHLVMYRRLALLRWIRSLQEKVVDQQNRLQESFDTILDNRKELIRCVQHDMGYAKNTAQAEM